ncbi:hypothetical protein [Peribacillus glennii]|nr:hypothetical protein [Peribacillus glennii]
MEEELVGYCRNCEKKIFCRNGFLDGVSEGKKLLCFRCADLKETDKVE